MKVDLELYPEEEAAIRKLADQAGCPPERVVHWAIAAYFRLRKQEARDRVAAVVGDA